MATVERALSYPYARRPGSFVHARGATLDISQSCVPWDLLDNGAKVGDLLVQQQSLQNPDSDIQRLEDAIAIPLETRLQDMYPVIAIGSNASPVQLQRKFADQLDAVVPAFGCYVSGFDSVYAAEITWYGSISATLVESAGTCFYSAVVRLCTCFSSPFGKMPTLFYCCF